MLLIILASGAATRVLLDVGQSPPPPPLTLPVAVVYSPVRVAPLMVLAVRPPSPAPTMGERARRGEQVSVELTQYCLVGRTRSGTLTREGIVAADPTVFPLGRELELFVDGQTVGRFRVEDTGRLVKGGVIDIWTNSCAKAIQFGRQKALAILLPPQAK